MKYTQKKEQTKTKKTQTRTQIICGGHDHHEAMRLTSRGTWKSERCVYFLEASKLIQKFKKAQAARAEPQRKNTEINAPSRKRKATTFEQALCMHCVDSLADSAGIKNALIFDERNWDSKKQPSKLHERGWYSRKLLSKLHERDQHSWKLFSKLHERRCNSRKLDSKMHERC